MFSTIFLQVRIKNFNRFPKILLLILSKGFSNDFSVILEIYNYIPFLFFGKVWPLIIQEIVNTGD